MRNCGDCGATPGELHRPGCDVECCVLCGGQSISCECIYQDTGFDVEAMEEEQPGILPDGPTDAMWKVYDALVAVSGGRLPWTGEWPGDEACREFDLWCYGPPWRFCEKDHPGATEDLNRLPLVAEWSREQRRWVKRV